jgi:hypothetical protein
MVFAHAPRASRIGPAHPALFTGPPALDAGLLVRCEAPPAKLSTPRSALPPVTVAISPTVADRPPAMADRTPHRLLEAHQP